MFNEGVTYAVCNTDSQSLSRSPVPVKLMLGQSGLGAGANPQLSKLEIEMQPVHKAVYLLFLAHPEDIEFKRLGDYMASYYIISGHTQKHVEGSQRIWYERLKVISLPRELVLSEI